MTPRESYRQAVASGKLLPDPAQEKAIEAFDDLYHRLVDDGERRTGLRA
ncbi:MAG: cell division protein ZapE, partial [Gammaproteobacteria bacterium]|nr:cell division protein ZapE [Gammaproteobacteria bacterium]